MTHHAISSPDAPAALGPYSQAIEVDGFVFCSGQIGLDPATGDLVEGIEAQTEQVLANIRAVLGAGGLAFGDVVKTTILLTDMGHFATVNGIYGKAVGDPPPARSTLAAAALPKGALIEIEVIARRHA